MPTVWLSTLKNLTHTLKVNPTELKRRFPEVETSPDNDLPITISNENKDWLDEQYLNLLYPACGSCTQSVLNCHCERQSDYAALQAEHQTLITTLNATELSVQKLVASPFRQSRNAFGFAASIFGGINLALANVSLAAPALWVSLLLPSLLLGSYVYVRGRREEGKINADLQADFLDKKINLLSKECEAIALRCNNHLTTACEKKTKPKLPKEKRDIGGNSLGHFIGSSLATAGITYTAIKYGAFSTLVPVGSLLCWVTTGAMSSTVGAYFAYKRYTHLSNKVQTEMLFGRLVTQESDMNALLGQLKRLPENLDNVFSSTAHIGQGLSQHTVSTTPLLSAAERVEVCIDEQKTTVTHNPDPHQQVAYEPPALR